MAKPTSDLPEGMVAEILLRLPVKALLQCKSVCKLWLSIISNSYFIKSHLHRAITASMINPSVLNIECLPPDEDNLAFDVSTVAILSTLDECTAELQQQRRRQCRLVNDGPSNLRQDLSSSLLHFDHLVMPRLFNHFRVISSYNGIICLANYFGSEVYLWNPSIRRCKKLPSFKPYATRSMPIKIGFGYDSISNSYKVFRIVYEKILDIIPIVQVYSTNDDIWRDFRAPILKNWKIYKQTNIVVNGVMYFDSGDELISFDLHKEVFGIVPFPNFIQRKGSDILDFEGFVAIVFASVGYGPGLNLWTLDDVSNKISWTKRFSIETDSETNIWLYCYLGAGQFYGYKLMNGNIFLYDCDEKKETKYYELGEENSTLTLKYTETLVSLDGFEQVLE
ncbi:putative F-box protein At1g32420 [Daucus carota subsp. sativus]|uniref:putative F-box protein At1g32420 n=1 Tax=Daucus carota subsp. sativus TaxID=79200 RepID=UPI0007EF728A|nr:PREDICTED: putative F-box protein At1g32420 [Daucus carota subsp. sativus]